MEQLMIKGRKVWVSRYANKELNEEKYKKIGISLGRPRFKIGYKLEGQLYSLAPGRDYFRASEDVFTEKYRAGLDSLGIEKVMSILEQVAEEDRDLVLLCFEDVDKDMCHRTLLADWIGEQKGVKPLELQDPSKMKKASSGGGKNNSRGQQLSFW